MASFIVKIEYGGVLRRMSLDGAGDHEFLVSYIQNRGRELFKLPADTVAEFTYIDSEGDVVALADDGDVEDALFLQGLNPLRITMVTKTPARNDVSPITSSDGSSSFARAASVAVNANAGAHYQLPTSLDDVITSATLSAAPDSPTSAASTTSKTASVDIETLIPEQWETWKGLIVAENPSEGALSAAGRTSLESNHSLHEGLPAAVPRPSQLEAAALRDSAINTEAEAKKGEEEELEEGEEEEGSVKNVPGVGNAVPVTTTPTPTPAEEGNDIHWGVQCDGCLTLPIKGPRFKSCKRSNYDLCIRCFASAVYDGDAEHTDFIRLNRRFHRLGDPANSGVNMRSLKLRYLFSTLRQGSKDVSADSSDSGSGKPLFRLPVKAASQCDECGMTPIEGPRYKSRTRFNYDLCQDCFERSGSDDREYSRIVVFDRPPVSVAAAPPVGAPAPTLARQSCIGGGDFASAFPTVEATWASFTKMMSLAEGQYQRMGALCERVISGIRPWKPIDYEIVRNEKKIPTPVPIVDFEGITAAEATAESQPDGSNQSCEGGVTDANVSSSSSAAAAALPPAAEEGGGLPELLVKLGDMGFNDEALNKEVLERNGLDFPKTLDDLCKEDWDPILEELEEMGFYDTDMNRRLMIEKQGSVQQVVKELVRVVKGESHA